MPTIKKTKGGIKIISTNGYRKTLTLKEKIKITKNQIERLETYLQNAKQDLIKLEKAKDNGNN